MNQTASLDSAHREKVKQFGALSYLLLLGGLALAGPYGMLSWGEGLSLLDKERADLKNRVALLDPDHIDPDMAGELIRSDLNVVHPDEYIFELPER